MFYSFKLFSVSCHLFSVKHLSFPMLFVIHIHLRYSNYKITKQLGIYTIAFPQLCIFYLTSFWVIIHIALIIGNNVLHKYG